MKKINTWYWITTGLLAFMMLMSGVFSLLQFDKSKQMMSGLLGYPAYIIPFLSIAKILGVLAILVPGFPKLRDWAYAGFFFDLTGAAYSMLMVNQGIKSVALFPVFYVLLFVSYFLSHKRIQTT